MNYDIQSRYHVIPFLSILFYANARSLFAARTIAA